jgi:hypothetical protein
MNLTNEDFLSNEDFQKACTDPMYCLKKVDELYTQNREPLVSEKYWINTNVNLINEMGPEKWLRLLLDNLKGNYIKEDLTPDPSFNAAKEKLFTSDFLNHEMEVGNIFKTISGGIHLIALRNFKKVDDDKKHDHREKITQCLNKEGFTYVSPIIGYRKRHGKLKLIN